MLTVRGEVTPDTAERLRNTDFLEHKRNFGFNFCPVCGMFGFHCKGRSAAFLRRLGEEHDQC